MLAERLEHGDHAQDRGPDEVPRRAGRHRLRHSLLLRRRHLGVHADNAGTELIQRLIALFIRSNCHNMSGHKVISESLFAVNREFT